MAKMTMVQALNLALRQEMERDDSVIVLGEDVGVDGGVFRVTDGLIDQFGDHCLRYGGHDPYVCSQCHGALSRWQMGYPQEAIGFCRDALDLAETLKHPPSTGVAVSLSAIFYQFTGDTASILALEEHADSAPTNMRLIMQAVAG